jgi:hypothetical protein
VFNDKHLKPAFWERINPFTILGISMCVLMMIWVLLWCIFFRPTPAHASDFEVIPRYGFTSDDIRLMALLVCGDKRVGGDGEYDIDFHNSPDHVEVYKVLCVVMNRVKHPKWPNTVEEVILQPGQFHVMPRNAKKNPSQKSLNVVSKWCEMYDNYDAASQVIPTDHLFFSGNGIRNKTR